MRPLPAWPTKTFQSPKLATSAGLAASALSPLSVFFEAASAGAKAPTRATTHRAAPARARQDREKQDNPENLIDIRPSTPAASRPRGQAFGGSCRRIGAKFRPSALRGG